MSDRHWWSDMSTCKRWISPFLSQYIDKYSVEANKSSQYTLQITDPCWWKSIASRTLPYAIFCLYKYALFCLYRVGNHDNLYFVVQNIHNAINTVGWVINKTHEWPVFSPEYIKSTYFCINKCSKDLSRLFLHIYYLWPPLLYVLQMY